MGREVIEGPDRLGNRPVTEGDEALLAKTDARTFPADAFA
jgi:hypothetical protein